MNAWQVTSNGGIDALTAATLPVAQPGPGEILVRVRAVSLNYRDLLHVLGYADQERWPLVPCSDGAGDVVAVGPAVFDSRPAYTGSPRQECRGVCNLMPGDDLLSHGESHTIIGAEQFHF